MAVSVPLINDPRGQLLGEALPFAHEQARLQCNNAISRAFEATGENTSMQVMLHLNARGGVKLLEMVANQVRGESESDVLVILMGREVDPELAGLLHHNDGSKDGKVSELIDDDSSFATPYHNDGSKDGYESELQGLVNEESSTISSLTLPSFLSSTISSLTLPSFFGGLGDEQGLPQAERLEAGSRGVEQETKAQDDFAANWDAGWMANSAVWQEERFANLRYEPERTRHLSLACTKLQRMWRRRRANTVNPRSVAAALEAMRTGRDVGSRVQLTRKKRAELESEPEFEFPNSISNSNSSSANRTNSISHELELGIPEGECW